jgi:hypothetical protein
MLEGIERTFSRSLEPGVPVKAESTGGRKAATWPYDARREGCC